MPKPPARILSVLDNRRLTPHMHRLTLGGPGLAGFPRDQATGTISGKRQHSPVTVVKPVDKASPLLYKALCTHEPVNSAEFRFFRPDRVGPEPDEHYYTVLLENGYVESITAIGRGMEKVGFVFQDITWTYEIGGATHKDSWKGE